MCTWWKKWVGRPGPTPTASGRERPTGAHATPIGLVSSVCALTDVGCRRQTNEDHVRAVAAAPSRTGHRALLVVADGMGGHAAGEVASRLAVETVLEHFEAGSAVPEELLPNAFRAANAAIYAAAGADARREGMGTTCTALLVEAGTAHMAHVGDSRLYLLRDGTLYQMSGDHSLVHELVNSGLLSLAAAEQHEDRNVVLRSLGTRPEVAVTSWALPLRVRPDDLFLVCSDGLSGPVSDAEMTAVLEAKPTLTQACDALVGRAHARGAPDNVSVGLLRVSAPPARPAALSPSVDVPDKTTGGDS